MNFDDEAQRALDRAWNCKLITVGRKTGELRSVTIWFALDDGDIVLAGGPEGPHWYKNLQACEDVELRIGGVHFHGRAAAVTDAVQAEAVRERFVERYLAARLSRPFGGYTRSVAVRVSVDRYERAPEL